jgi:hypothetical protein
MSRSTEYVTVEVERVKRESQSGLAVLLVIDGRDIWVPRLVIREPEMVDAGATKIDVEIAQWFVEKEDIPC